jgi:hypothetical protein
LDIAYSRNNSFWFGNLSYFYSFMFHYIDGAVKSSLFYLLKAHELNKSDEGILEAVLDFQLPPEIILSREEATFYANKLLELNPKNKRALDLKKSN